jgi:ribosomal protein L36
MRSGCGGSEDAKEEGGSPKWCSKSKLVKRKRKIAVNVNETFQKRKNVHT